MDQEVSAGGPAPVAVDPDGSGDETSAGGHRPGVGGQHGGHRPGAGGQHGGHRPGAAGPHGGPHDHRPVEFTQEFWDERYSSADRLWSGRPNPHLVTTVARLSPGTALDLGCGEGADAIWLAAQGWRVTAVDVSQVALDRAARQALAAGADVAGRITWQRVDALSWEPAPLRFDLVSAQFMQLPEAQREALHRRLAAAVRPGGTLLIVGHHPSDLRTSVGRPDLPGLMFTAEQAAATLEPARWREVSATSPAREVTDPDGQPVTIHDAVLTAIRCD